MSIDEVSDSRLPPGCGIHAQSDASAQNCRQLAQIRPNRNMLALDTVLTLPRRASNYVIKAADAFTGCNGTSRKCSLRGLIRFRPIDRHIGAQMFFIVDHVETSSLVTEGSKGKRTGSDFIVDWRPRTESTVRTSA